MEPTELEELLTNIQKLQSIMIGVATNQYRIQEKEEEYEGLYQDIASQISHLQYEGRSIENPNNFHTLWTWHTHWKSKLKKSAWRGGYIHNLYQNVCNQIDFNLCKHYIQTTSPEALDKEIEPSQIEELKVKIEKLQEIMTEVATEGNTVSLIQYNEEDYSQLYREVGFKIGILRERGIPISYSNEFRSLWQWYSFYSEKLESTKNARQEHINKLYIEVLKPIDRALKQYRTKPSSTQEFIQDLQCRFNQRNFTAPTTYQIPTAATQNVDERFQQQTSELVPNSIFIPLTQDVDNFYAPTNSTLTWTDDNIMNPEIFLEQEDVVHLEDSLEKLFATKFDNASSRRSVFSSSNVEGSFIRNINFNSNPVEFTNVVVAKFKDYKVSNQRVDYHPMVNLLHYLLKRQESYELEDQDVELFNRLAERGQENFKALKARNSVCRIESPKGKGIGTGVLVEKNLLLTCNHIFNKTQVRQAWVRFNYNVDSRQLDKDLFELDMTFVSYHNRPDYALVKIKGNTQQQIAIRSDAILDSGQEIRVIHHPLGNPVVISDLGQIIQVGEDYIDHNLKTDDGSSGAPIFNSQWELIAIHQGKVGIGRNFEPGSTGCIPIRAIWNQILPHLN